MIKIKVFVGMSGGVDSSVSAALLQEAGYDVTGVFIKVWQPPEELLGAGNCTWKEDRRDAMRVAATLGIPFLTLNLEKEYKKEVVDYMIAEYRAGKTPNPDVMCNKDIKFGAFFDFAIKKGADYVATGHYARVKNKQLLEGKDKNKDQSYFLWTLTQKQISKTLFPIGNLEKASVRKLAKKFKLPNADKKDSQGLCFIGKVDMKEFLQNYIKPKKGKVLNESGKVIGEHDGTFFFTVGQRHGFRITEKTSNDKPYYIIRKDIKKNTLSVSNKAEIREKNLVETECRLKNLNWISAPVRGALSARIRYRQEKQKIILTPLKNGWLKVSFQKPQEGLSAGQSLVIYKGEKCLGGGIIV